MLRLVFIIFRKKGDFTSSIFLLQRCEATRCLCPQHSPTPTPTLVIRKRTQCFIFCDTACLMWSPQLIIARGLCVSGHVVRASDTSPKCIGHEGLRRHSTRTWTRPLCSAAERPLCYRQTLRERRRMGLGNDYATYPCARSYLPSKQGLK